MSADAWSVCPFCRKKAEAEHEAKITNLLAQYGTLPADEWLALKEAIPAEFDVDGLRRTLRQDWEIGFAEDGNSTEGRVILRVSCTECGASLTRDEAVTLEPGR